MTQRSYVRNTVHVVFATRYEARILTLAIRERLGRYITSLLTKKRCRLRASGGDENHLHLLLDLHPDLALADLVKSIKLATSELLRADRPKNGFDGWKLGYLAFSVESERLDEVRTLIHLDHHLHQSITFTDQMHGLCGQIGVTYTGFPDR